MADIRPLTLGEQPLVINYLRRFPPEISEQTFTNLYAWGETRPMFFLEMADTVLFLSRTPPGVNRPYLLFGPPVGAMASVDVISELGKLLTGGVRMSASAATQLGQAGYPIRLDRDNADYVYKVADMAGLEGRRYSRKRNLIKQCLQQYECTYEPITPAIIPECLVMQRQWCQERQCELDVGLCGEMAAIEETFARFAQFSLLGGAIRVDGIIRAYTLGERLSPDTAVCHFEKAMRAYAGLSQLITHWFAVHGLTDFAFINREQDLGIPGLRQAKESYYPHHLVEKYQVDF